MAGKHYLWRWENESSSKNLWKEGEKEKTKLKVNLKLDKSFVKNNFNWTMNERLNEIELKTKTVNMGQQWNTELRHNTTDRKKEWNRFGNKGIKPPKAEPGKQEFTVLKYRGEGNILCIHFPSHILTWLLVLLSFFFEKRTQPWEKKQKNNQVRQND